MDAPVLKPETSEDPSFEREVFGYPKKVSNSRANIGVILSPVRSLASLNNVNRLHSKTLDKYRICELKEPSSIFLRVILALAACICLIWMTWLIILNIDPNGTVNYGMNTENLEDGTFWRLVDPPKAMLGLATFKFSIVFIGYFSVFVRVVTRRGFIRAIVTRRHSTRAHNNGKIAAGASDSHLKTSSPKSKAVKELAISLTVYDSPARKHLKLWMKVVELTLQTISLYQALESGTPVGLVTMFTTIVAFNALACAVMMFLPMDNIRLAENLVDTLFNFLVAVGYPMLVLFYCRNLFTFDRAKLAINVEVFPAGWQEQSATAIADPVQRAIIYKCLKGLRILSLSEFLTHTGVNVVQCFQMHCTVDVIKNPRKQRGREYPRRSYWGAFLLVAFSVSLVIFVEESIRTSSHACQPHPECPVNAHRWTILENDSLTQCPCIILIDRNAAPRSYEEWQFPKNVSDKVHQLATTGDLQTLELVNRNLPVFPEELRGCKRLNYLALWYTNTKSLPSWMDEFTYLEYLHMDNKETNEVVAFPDGMLDNMEALTFLRLAGFSAVRQLPSLRGLTHLKTLSLAAFVLLEELPSFDSLSSLERLILAEFPSIHTLPDFTPLKKLKSFAVVDRGSWCCNGFLDSCNLTDPGCGVHPIWQTPASTCLTSDQVATPGTLEIVTKFSKSVCGSVAESGTLETPPTAEAITFCNGTMYKQCMGWNDISDSMCYSSQFMAIGCTTTSFPAKMRRRQIAEGVGDPCNSVVEAWLGCK